MKKPIQPLLSIHVVWHPDFVEGQRLARKMLDRFQGDPLHDLNLRVGIPVLFPSMSAADGQAPQPIDAEQSELTAVVVLVNASLVGSPEWIEYFRVLERLAAKHALRTLLVPVIFDGNDLRALGTKIQAIRLDKWHCVDQEIAEARFFALLLHQLCRMLRVHLDAELEKTDSEAYLEAYLRKVQVFLSHSKHDSFGEPLALSLRKCIHDDLDLGSFFDLVDISPGLPFDDVILHSVRRSAIVVIHTDSYATREWCRREALEAKLHGRPIVVANCLADREERGFPYLGNVPVVRVNPTEPGRLIHVVVRLLEEILKQLLWEGRTRKYVAQKKPGVEFVSSWPELLTLVRIGRASAGSKSKRGPLTLVYPDPPLSNEEERLFEALLPGTDLKSFRQWQAATGL